MNICALEYLIACHRPIKQPTTTSNSKALPESKLLPFLQLSMHKLGFSDNAVDKLLFDEGAYINQDIDYDEQRELKIGDKIILGNWHFLFPNGLVLQPSNNKFIDSYIDFLGQIVERKPENLLREVHRKSEAMVIVASLIRLAECDSKAFEQHRSYVLFMNFIDEQIGHVIYHDLGIRVGYHSFHKIEKLVETKKEIESSLLKSIQKFQNIDHLQGVEQELRRLLNTDSCKWLLHPFLPVQLSDNLKLDSIFKPLRKFAAVSDKENRLREYEEFKSKLSGYAQVPSNQQLASVSRLLRPFQDVITKTCNEYVFGGAAGKAQLQVSVSDKRFPLHPESLLDLQLRLKNNGVGFAGNILIKFHCENLDILQKEWRQENYGQSNLSFAIRIKVPSDFKGEAATINGTIKWQNLDNSPSKEDFVLTILAQSGNIPWDEINNQSPYQLTAVEDLKFLSGRDDIIGKIVNNIERSNISSFILHGQKRVGKTSIVKSLQRYFNDSPDKKVCFAYFDSTGSREANAGLTLNNVGTVLSNKLKKELLFQNKDNDVVVEALKSIVIPVFSGSLSPLNNYIEALSQIIPGQKLVFVLDEFDEMQYELYAPGDMSETFFRNLRGINNEHKNVAFILVGSENMSKIYNWHGEQLNNWNQISVDTFDEHTQFEFYRELVTNPVKPYLQFSEEAIREIFRLSGGNPYFTNMICAWIYEHVSEKRDAEITTREVELSVEKHLGDRDNGVRFAHFWKDGILAPSAKKEQIADNRRRTLLSIIRSSNLSMLNLRDSYLFTQLQVQKNFRSPSELIQAEQESIKQINDFKARHIIVEVGKGYQLQPPIFAHWLLRYGLNEIVEGSPDLEELRKEIEIEKSQFITDLEITELIRDWQYQGKNISKRQIRQWLEAFGGNSSQRLVFNLVKEINYYSTEKIKNLLRPIIRTIFKGEQFALAEDKGASSIKRINTFISYFKTATAEKDDYLKIVRQLSFIRSSEYVRPLSTVIDHFNSDTNHLIIFEPILFSADEILIELIKFREKFLGKQSSVKVYLLSFVAIEEELNKLQQESQQLFPELIIHVADSVQGNKAMPFQNNSKVFADKMERSELMTLHNQVTGYPLTEKTLNIVFEPMCPQSTIPALWLSGEWPALFPNSYLPPPVLTSNTNSERIREECMVIGSKLERRMLQVTKEILSQEFGKDEEGWWVNGIPENIRMECAQMWEKDKRRENIEAFLYFIQFSVIAEKNKGLQTYFYYKKGGSDKPLEWLRKLNEIRNHYAHPLKRAPSEDDLEFLKTVSAAFNSRTEKLLI